MLGYRNTPTQDADAGESCTAQSWKTSENTGANDVVTTNADSDRHSIRQETKTTEEGQKDMTWYNKVAKDLTPLQ